MKLSKKNKKIIILLSLVALYIASYLGLRIPKILVYRVAWNNSIDYETGVQDTSVRLRKIDAFNTCFPYEVLFKPLMELELGVRSIPKPLPKYSDQQLKVHIEAVKKKLNQMKIKQTNESTL